MRSGRHKLNLLRSVAVAGGACGSGNGNNCGNFIDTHYTTRNNSGNGGGPHSPPSNKVKSTNNQQIINNNRSSSPKSFSSVVTAIETNLNVVLDSNYCRMDLSETAAKADVRLKAYEICREYLNGAWKQLELKDLVLSRVNGGLSNWLYYCSLPMNMPPVENEPTQVLLRFYGQGHGENALESLITELVICTLLSERKLGPKLYGVFPGGRIEQFIPSRPLQTPELRDLELSRQITHKMAQIHALNIPISKHPCWLWDTMDRWMSTVRDSLVLPKIKSVHDKEIAKALVGFNLEGELEWLRTFLPSLNSPIVFAHNDMQEGNILIRNDPKAPPNDKLVVIDFEYCSYNYRGFDLANHFCEWMYNYNVAAFPHFTYQPKDGPSHEEQLRFIRWYLTVLRSEYALNHPELDKDFLQQSDLFNENHIIKEVAGFTLASHFFWCLWSIVNAQVSKISFGYWDYALSRIEAYQALKNERFSGFVNGQGHDRDQILLEKSEQ